MVSPEKVLAQNEAVIRQFIAELIGDDIHLAAIMPDGGIEGRYFGNDVEAAVQWAIALNRAGRNIYWTTNRCHPAVGRKPDKTEILSARYVHVDIDPPKDGSPFNKAAVISALEMSTLPPSVIVDSGNGAQALWRVQDTDALECVESINKAFAKRWGGGQLPQH